MTGESLTTRMINEKIREQRDALRDALGEIRDVLIALRGLEVDAEEALHDIGYIVDALPWYAA